MKIIFVRHGEKLEDIDSSGLTEKGKRQAKLLAKRLKKFIF